MTKATRNKGNKNKNGSKVPKSKLTKILWIVRPIALVGLIVWLILAYGMSPATPPTSNNSSGPADRVEVVYFHRTQQCYTCRYAEEGTRYTVETYFGDELASGKLTFQSIDVQDSKNAAIVEKYGAYTSSLFINTVKDGTDHIEQVTDIWLS
ncbi:MAG: hypothetical protein J7L92_06170 [Dehalococcoidia bacterium]|nr:hypothetical protein [Dehalococcoidia bacterium]